MKAILENHNGIDYLTFTVNEEIGITQLPVIIKGNRDSVNAWTWNGDLEKPTLRPSIRTKYDNGKEMTEIHYWLTDGVCHCLGDCKDGNSGESIELKDICPMIEPQIKKNKKFNNLLNKAILLTKKAQKNV